MCGISKDRRCRLLLIGEGEKVALTLYALMATIRRLHVMQKAEARPGNRFNIRGPMSGNCTTHTVIFLVCEHESKKWWGMEHALKGAVHKTCVAIVIESRSPRTCLRPR